MNSREEPRGARVKNGMDLSQDVDLTRIFIETRRLTLFFIPSLAS